VYFEYHVRPRSERIALSSEQLRQALEAEGCQAAAPRYPLLHQQPFFTEGHFRNIVRLPPDVPPPDYRTVQLPQTTGVNGSFIKLPSFPHAQRELLDQYVHAFQKVVAHAGEVAAALS
jgi:dTDP-4-amino-4,6-dideoxygalactose transaminase